MRRVCRVSGDCLQILNTSGGSSQVVVGRMSQDGSYSVLVSTSLVHVAEAGQVLSDMLPLIAILVFAFALAAAWLFSQWFTRPLRDLSAAARRVAGGDYSVHVGVLPAGRAGHPGRRFQPHGQGSPTGCPDAAGPAGQRLP